jgi:hypothetical protein
MAKQVFYTWVTEWECNFSIDENRPHLFDTESQCIDALLEDAHADWGHEFSDSEWKKRRKKFRSELAEGNVVTSDFGHVYYLLQCTYDPQ